MILEHIYTWTCFWSALAGWVARLMFVRSRAKWLDKHEPLPDGSKHRVDRVSKVWLAGAAGLLTLGYVLLTAQKSADQARSNQQHTIELTHKVAQCWSESYQATKAQIRINAENDAISRQQQALQRLFDIASSDWLKQLVQPPGDLAKMDTNSPERQAWGLQVTAQYQAKLNDLGAQSDDLVKQRAALDVERKQHPLPETTCGK